METMETKRAESWAERPDSLFDLLTDSEIEGLDGLVAVIAAAEAEVRRLNTAFQEADDRLTTLASRARRNPINAAARFLGEAPPLPESTGNDPALSDDPRELRDALEGLKVRRADAQRASEDARKVLDREVSRLVRVAAERSAERYVAHAQELWRHWAILSSAQRFVVDQSLYGFAHTPDHIFPDLSASKLFIPGGTETEPLRKASEGASWGLPVIHSGEDDRGATMAAYNRFLAALDAHRARPTPPKARRTQGL